MTETAKYSRLNLEMREKVACVTICRPSKRNGVSDDLVAELQDCFTNLPREARAAVLTGESQAFCAGLDLSAVRNIDTTESVRTADEGHRARISQYMVGEGEGEGEGDAKAFELATMIAANAPMTNYGVMHVLPRIADQSIQDGTMTEAVMAAVASSDPATRERLAAFLDAKANKVRLG